MKRRNVVVVGQPGISQLEGVAAGFEEQNLMTCLRQIRRHGTATGP